MGDAGGAAAGGSADGRVQSLKSKVQSSGVEEWVQKRLRWEDWETLLPELIEFAKGEFRRRKWRGSKSGVLPQGFDDNSVASEVVMAALQGKARLAPGWTRQRLMKELKRKTSNEVRRLHKLMETRAVRSEWDVLWPRESEALRSVFAGMTARSSVGGSDDGQGVTVEAVTGIGRGPNSRRNPKGFAGGLPNVMLTQLNAQW